MGKAWHASSTGPDEVDIETMMRAIGALHSGTVGVTLSPLGIGSTGGMTIQAAINLDVLPGSSIPSVIKAESDWPCAVCGSFLAHVYSVLYALDSEIGRTYKNERLWT